MEDTSRSLVGPSLWAVFALGLLFAFCLRRQPRYPPGPRGLPIVGNVFDIPMNVGWKVFRDVSRCFGSDVIHYEALGSHLVVVNGAKAAKELFERRANNYSDRKQSIMVNELTGWHRNWGQLEYGDRWRQHRRLFHQHFRPLAVSQYHPRQVKGVRVLLRALSESPEDFQRHIRFMAGATIMEIVYAYDAQPGDPRIKLVEDAVDTLTFVVNAGVYLVDVFPILKYVPTWFPGASFKRQAAEWKKLVDALYEQPYQEFKATVKEGIAKPCFAATLLSSVENDEDIENLEELFMGLTGTAFVAGSDTTIASLNVFILAVTIFPEAQRSAQEEIDRVLERKRLPTMEDTVLLPHVTALVHETLRWHPPLPLAAPHRVIEDDEYEGYFIPAGTTIIGNAWAILRDEDVFPDGDSFKPERWLNEAGALRDDLPYPMETFGFGRRICPGRHFANDVLWLAIANILTVFSIERALGEDGQPIVPEAKFSPRLISKPEPFKCAFKHRFSGAEDMIRLAAIVEE
uniref:Cytochrome P450 n=1 Tax=Phanerodontia chrysosporium TaxID=2822231 RepID=G5EJQ1_PHACH|nr:cytochrome P450 [Phanerodontia chrysosporium]